MSNNRGNTSFSSSLFVVFFIIIVTLSLPFAGIVIGNANNVSMGAYAQKISSDKLLYGDSGTSSDINAESGDANPTPELSQPDIPTSEGSGSSPPETASTTTQTDDQNEAHLFPKEYL